MTRKITFAIIYTSIAFVALVVIWGVVRWTGVIQTYHASTSVNEPTISTGSMIMGSNLKDPKRGDFIFYRPDSVSNEIYIHRICAIGGDTLLIKDGVVYINGKNFDINLNLKRVYSIPTGIALSLKNKKIINDDLSYRLGDSTIVLIEEKIVVAQHLPAKRRITPFTEPDELIEKKHGQPWNKDNFGPLVIPQSHFFVLGDNRDNSMDSRYIGLISLNQWIGTRWE